MPKHPHSLRRTRTDTGRARPGFSAAALALLLVFGFVAYAGCRMVAFDRLEGQLGRSALAFHGDTDHGIRGAMEAISTWKTSVGTATPARALALNVLMRLAPGDTAAMESALRELAESSPTSVGAWQALVAIQQARRAPIESLLPAFRMSAVTGSHEGYFMIQRATFGLEHWTELPEADRRTVISDVLATIGWGPAAVHDTRMMLAGYGRILATKPEAEREEIRRAIMASGLATQEALKALGV